MTDRIEKIIELKAPIERVWRAILDAEEFGAWFRVKLDGPFRAGEVSRGRMTYPGYEHLPWEVKVTKIEPPRLFAFTWHPYAVDPKVDYSGEPETLVEFRLEPIGAGTRLVITETGFEALPAGRRSDALRSNEGGWAQQAANVRDHVGG